MTIPKFVSLVCKLEGKKKEVEIAQVGEVLR